MNTITNKKGNEGYKVKEYNYFHNNIRDTATDVQIKVTHVRVKSCGKKRMHLEVLGEQDYSYDTINYNPNMPLYADMESAEEAARVMYEREDTILPLKIVKAD